MYLVFYAILILSLLPIIQIFAVDTPQHPSTSSHHSYSNPSCSTTLITLLDTVIDATSSILHNEVEVVTEKRRREAEILNNNRPSILKNRPRPYLTVPIPSASSSLLAHSTMMGRNSDHSISIRQNQSSNHTNNKSGFMNWVVTKTSINSSYTNTNKSEPTTSSSSSLITSCLSLIALTLDLLPPHSATSDLTAPNPTTTSSSSHPLNNGGFSLPTSSSSTTANVLLSRFDAVAAASGASCSAANRSVSTITNSSGSINNSGSTTNADKSASQPPDIMSSYNQSLNRFPHPLHAWSTTPLPPSIATAVTVGQNVGVVKGGEVGVGVGVVNRGERVLRESTTASTVVYDMPIKKLITLLNKTITLLYSKLICENTIESNDVYALLAGIVCRHIQGPDGVSHLTGDISHILLLLEGSEEAYKPSLDTISNTCNNCTNKSGLRPSLVPHMPPSAVSPATHPLTSSHPLSTPSHTTSHTTSPPPLSQPTSSSTHKRKRGTRRVSLTGPLYNDNNNSNCDYSDDEIDEQCSGSNKKTKAITPTSILRDESLDSTRSIAPSLLLALIIGPYIRTKSGHNSDPSSSDRYLFYQKSLLKLLADYVPDQR